MKKEYEIRLLEKKEMAQDNWFLTFSCPEIADTAKPGQFVNLSCSRLLKRPFGIADTNKEKGTFSIGVKVSGEGTREITSYPVDYVFDALGPLGNAFSFDGVKKIIAVGGGTGIYPLHFALKTADEMGIPTICVNGFRSKNDAFLVDECSRSAQKAIFTTDAGDFGIQGTVLDGLASLSKEEIEFSHVFCVGPEIMMKHVSSWAEENGLFCQVSMEKRMACGIGVCLVCVCKLKAKEEGKPFKHVRCCKDGPVFLAEEVIW